MEIVSRNLGSPLRDWQLTNSRQTESADGRAVRSLLDYSPADAAGAAALLGLGGGSHVGRAEPAERTQDPHNAAELGHLQQQMEHYQRVLEATRAVIADDPTMGMKSVFAAVRGRMEPSDAPKTKEVRRALAEVKPKAPKPVPRADAAPSAAPDPDTGSHPRADYTGCRADPAALSSSGAEAQRRLLRGAQSFVETHRVLLEQQAFDIYFVVDNMWEKHVPLEWRDTLAAASVSQLAGLCLGKVPERWPPSLHDFVRTAQSLQLDPTPRRFEALAECATAPGAAGALPKTAAPPAGGSWRQHWQGASPKKREEMERMASAVVSAARAAGTQNIVDVGSGKGYLSSLLALEHGMSVLAVEGNGKFTAAAEKRVSRIARLKAAHVRPPSDDMGPTGLPGDASFLGAASSDPVSYAGTGSASGNAGSDKPSGPIFVTAMVKAVRDGEASPTDQQTTGEDDENRTRDQAVAEERKIPPNTAAPSSESTSGGVAGAALRVKEARSRAMRRQYTTGAAATAVTAAAATSSAASSTCVVGDYGAAEADGHHLRKRPRPVVHLDPQSEDGDLGDNNDGSTDREERADSAGEQSVESLLAAAGLRGGAVLVGLHTCGDLAADSCRLFLRTPQLAGLVLCGCCYGRLTEPANFPLSSSGKQAQLQLGYTLRDLATHRVYGIAAKPAVWHERVLYTASYRATLEAFIRTCPAYAGGKLPPKAIQHCSVRKNVVAKPSFGAWALRALAEAQMNARAAAALADNVGSRAEESETVGEKELQAFYDQVMGTPTAGPHRLMALEALAACVWPVVEALVVVDRLAFLQENMDADAAETAEYERGKAAATLQPLFDPLASPRNWVLVATRAPASR